MTGQEGEYTSRKRTMDLSETLSETAARYEQLLTEMALLREIDGIDILQGTLASVCGAIVGAVTSQLAIENCSIMLVDEKGEYLDLRAVSSPLEDRPHLYEPGEWTGRRFRVGEGIVGRAAGSGEPVHVADISRDEHYVKIGGTGTGTLMCFPLKVEGRVIGALNVSHPEPQHFSVETERILNMVSERIGRLITVRRLYQQIAESETRYRLVTENAGDVIIVFGRDGRVLTINPAAVHVTGYSVADFTEDRTRWQSRVFEADLPLFAEHIEHAADARMQEVFRYRFLDAAGGLRFLEQRNSPLQNSAEEAGNVVAIVRDVTAERLAELERARLAAAVEHAAEAIVVADRQGVIQYVNPAFEQILGFPRAEAVGSPVKLFWSDCHEPAFYHDILRLVESGATWTGRFTGRRRDGGLRELDATVSPIRDDKGVVTSYVGVQRDVTSQSLLEEQLRQSQKMQAIGALAGGIAHDFNNLLSVMLGYMELLVTNQLEGEGARKALSEVAAAGERAKDLVAQILTFSRHTPMERRPLETRSVVREALRLIGASIPTVISIVDDLAEDTGFLFADITEIHQIVMNLCANAYQAMMPRGGTLTVRLRPCVLDRAALRERLGLDEGRYVHLSVEDTGCGMDRRTVERVFEPFFSTKKESGGTGLGLATVHGIVTSLSGQVYVTSELGKGTRFDVYIPAAESAPQEKRQEHRQFPKGNGERILLVDDEQTVLDLCSEMLEHWGYQVAAFGSPRDALAAFEKAPGRFDLLITDNMMPHLSGVDLALAVQAIRPEIPILLVTGYSESLTGDQAIAMGVSKYLLKPFRASEFGEAVRQLLSPGLSN